MAAQQGEDISEHSSEEEFVAEDPAPKRKEALIWKKNSFPEGEKKVNAAKVTCKVCGTVLSRGDPNKKYSFGTASMVKHVKTLHPRNYARAACDRLREDPPPAVASTSTAPSSPHPDIRPDFADLNILCKFCKETLCYGEQSIDLICRRKQNHRCSHR